MKVHELLNDSSKWTKKASARNIQKESVPAHSSLAVCWCLLGAIDKCYENTDEDNTYLLTKAIVKELGFNNLHDTAHFNDSHTFEEVKALVLKHDI